MNVVQMLAKHQESFLKAKEELEATRLRRPDLQFPAKRKEKTIANLRARVESLTKAKREAVRDFDQQIKFYQSEIARLSKELKEDKSKLDPNVITGRRKKKITRKKVKPKTQDPGR